MDSCVCREALQNSFATVREAVYGPQDTDVIIANSELLAQSDEKWLQLYRCRICGTEWTEACYSGQESFDGGATQHWIYRVGKRRYNFSSII